VTINYVVNVNNVFINAICENELQSVKVTSTCKKVQFVHSKITVTAAKARKMMIPQLALSVTYFASPLYHDRTDVSNYKRRS